MPYKGSVETISAFKPRPMVDNYIHKDLFAPTRADALHDRALAAESAEMEEYIEMMGWQAEEFDNITFTYANEDGFPSCEQEVYNNFVLGVLAEKNFYKSATVMLEMAREMERYPDLSEQVDHKRLVAELGAYLIKSFCELAKIDEFLSDHLVFKLNLIAGYMEADNKSNYFGSEYNVRRAEHFELLRAGE